MSKSAVCSAPQSRPIARSWNHCFAAASLYELPWSRDRGSFAFRADPLTLAEENRKVFSSTSVFVLMGASIAQQLDAVKDLHATLQPGMEEGTANALNRLSGYVETNS